jgi:hypothetical protein
MNSADVMTTILKRAADRGEPRAYGLTLFPIQIEWRTPSGRTYTTTPTVYDL